MSISIVENRDCLDAMKEFPDKFFDLAIVDPPYGRKEHGGKNRSGYAKQKNGNLLYVADGNYSLKDWDNKPPTEEYFKELIRVSKNQIIWGVNYFDYNLSGGRIIWDKCNDGADQSNAEIAYCSINKRVDIFRFMWRGMFQGKSMEEGTVQQGNKQLNEARIHPTHKPVALYQWILSKYAKQGDKILDTHLGSGSSRIACYNGGYDFWGYEIDKEYFEKQEQRFENHTSQLRMEF